MTKLKDEYPTTYEVRRFGDIVDLENYLEKYEEKNQLNKVRKVVIKFREHDNTWLVTNVLMADNQVGALHTLQVRN